MVPFFLNIFRFLRWNNLASLLNDSQMIVLIVLHLIQRLFVRIHCLFSPFGYCFLFKFDFILRKTFQTHLFQI